MNSQTLFRITHAHLKEIDKSGGRKNWQVAVKTANEMFQQIEEKKKKTRSPKKPKGQGKH